MSKEFTASEIAALVAEANGLELSDHTPMLHRIKYLAKKGILVPARQLDARGTLAFQSLEIYRAAVFVELLGMAMDVRAMDAVKGATVEHFAGGVVAPSQQSEGGAISRGALQDAVNGVAQGEQWSLKIWRVNPGLRVHSNFSVEAVSEEIRAAFVCGDPTLWSPHFDEMFQRKPTRTVLTVDLLECFRDLIPIVEKAEKA